MLDRVLPTRVGEKLRERQGEPCIFSHVSSVKGRKGVERP